ncbi:MAG TPA: hypothetical protein VEA59_01605, partial [Patescibacteria group bacterium]|nr:hypothetical protein [Patescibacteria group bacterium]
DKPAAEPELPGIDGLPRGWLTLVPLSKAGRALRNIGRYSLATPLFGVITPPIGEAIIVMCIDTEEGPRLVTAPLDTLTLVTFTPKKSSSSTREIMHRSGIQNDHLISLTAQDELAILSHLPKL